MERYELIWARSEQELQGLINKQAEQGYRLVSIAAYSNQLGVGQSTVWLVAAMEKEEQETA